ncbi:Frag1/DRAM/Sfk1 family protein [Aspergillus glaucus CBS 516.65]|uniref:CWH43-like N-terminal domain-containing protein n=1 Tax=Aspergillus glaucus CBS 516.65 TaxID=1160497 RepID=A0A1L9W0D0_ASPGL|nr:hypothetical protein ASPGLDRAFT_114765 [Aspergillus glaucus CBS 516.65]OJJ89537.1 hypothetical protein ASPGLDRAFT_114765 [Aspergillus glaucus CBS 516.65]
MWIVSFWVFPLISACMWLAMLIAMLVVWAHADGAPVYPSMEEGQTIAYISDVGAQHLKPLFVAGSVVTVVFLDLGFLAERWLRHAGQLVPNKGRFDKACAIGSIFFSIAGALGLILLSCFDTLRHPNKHDGFLAMFLAGYIISAILICAEYLRLGIFYRSQHRVLFASFVMKLTFIVVEIALAIAFGVTGKHKNQMNVSSVLEWVIAFIFTGYVLSFVVDLLPSVRTRRHVPQGHKQIAMTQMGSNITSTTANENAVIEEPLTMDSTGPAAGYYRGQRI